MSERAFSAEVSLTLTLAGNDYRLSHVGPDFFILREGGEEELVGQGQLTVQVDSHIEVTPIIVERPVEKEIGRYTYREADQPAPYLATTATR